ncbi:hypothetical protein ROLI_015110 [Roseobacter fucihabitans]|uniref:Type IV pilus biogenesis n=2 Tax=Roseobacter fucihabitans TaxID=1537242 RepID=A0ABZ2BSY8_9RHOB|nr:hypothetical protein [Roseobacter litoralis]
MRLQQSGARLATRGSGCKLVIPNQQVRYLSIQTGECDPEQIHQAAYDALNGATPYAMEELAFDVITDADRSHIAAVARETLEEAEAFALEHGFDPVCFVAVPEEDAFAWEPFFGAAQSSRDRLASVRETEQDMRRDAPAKAGLQMQSTRPAGDEGNPAVMAATLGNAQGAESATIGRTPEQGIPAPEFSSRRRGTNTPPPPAFPKPASPVPIAGGFAETATPFEGQGARHEARAAPNAALITDEAARLTTFGARAQANTPEGSRQPVLIVACFALLVLLGVLAFASGRLPAFVAVLFDREQGGGVETTAIQVAPPLPNPVRDGPTDAASPTRDVDVVSPAESLSDEDAAVLNALRAPLETSSETETSTLITQEFLAKYAVSGIWPRAPEVPSPPPLVDIEDLYVTSIDPIEPGFDAVALPQLEVVNRDSAIDAPASPAAAGITFKLDDRGLVIAQPGGAVSPDGVTVFSGAPPVRPANLPERGTSETQNASNPARASLAAFRPQLRPDDIVETTERATLEGLTRSELAQIRPPLRPTLASAGGGNAAAASLVPLEGNTANQDPNDAATSGVAVVTQRPGIRPSNFNQIVARSQNTAATIASTGGAASIAPRAVVKPSIPSSASVAREATVRNAINLRKVNLIGVYGTPSQRRALVRLANGRYKKVEVGDRIDGGNISAIGEGELRYQKSGRNIILKMPKG